MKYNKLKAFTLAELMILLLTLSIIMAAFAPVFTRRYNNAATDDVWAFVSSDDNEDAYFDVVNKNYTAQAFIGLTPADQSAVLDMVKAGSDILYSKLIISAGSNAKYDELKKKQNQILFRYAEGKNDKDGDAVGALFADGSNLLLGGLYNANVTSGLANTSFGVKTLEKLSSGHANTAVGYGVMNELTNGSYNTAAGQNAAAKVNSTGNTIFGTNAYRKASGPYNTILGYHAVDEGSGGSSNNTVIGYSAAGNIASTGSNNTAIGPFTLSSLTTGKYNTAVGYNSMKNLTSGEYNTAVGAFSCNSSDLTSGSYKTCIGYNSGNTGMSSLYSSTTERVFIGGAPAQYIYDHESNKPAAVLEIHNVNSTSDNSGPIPFMGDASVVINGNLIVRGNSYFETPLKRPSNIYKAYIDNGGNDNAKDEYYDAKIPKGLVLFRLGNNSFKVNSGTAYVFQAYDGIQRTEPSWETCRGGCGRGSHAYKDVRPNCICTAVNSSTFINSFSYSIGRALTNFDTTYDRYDKDIIIKSSTSYDWASKTFALAGSKENTRSPYNGTNKIYPSYFGGNSVSCNNFFDRNGADNSATQNTTSNEPGVIDNNPTAWVNNAAFYKDRSFDKYIYLERRANRCRGGYDNDGDCLSWEYGLKGTDKPYAHMRLRNEVGYENSRVSCCPILTNDSSQSGPYKDLHERPNDTFQLSDKRLKDIGEKFTAGLEEIRKLNVYNFTFKTDKNQVPQVGVIAQDLRLVFPNAVEKDKDGYYQIRWDEMFYAAINSIKTLYAKAENLIARVTKDKQRISNLKSENAELNAKLDALEKEIVKLEADR